MNVKSLSSPANIQRPRWDLAKAAYDDRLNHTAILWGEACGRSLEPDQELLDHSPRPVYLVDRLGIDFVWLNLPS